MICIWFACLLALRFENVVYVGKLVWIGRKLALNFDQQILNDDLWKCHCGPRCENGATLAKSVLRGNTMQYLVWIWQNISPSDIGILINAKVNKCRLQSKKESSSKKTCSQSTLLRLDGDFSIGCKRNLGAYLASGLPAYRQWSLNHIVQILVVQCRALDPLCQEHTFSNRL